LGSLNLINEDFKSAFALAEELILILKQICAYFDIIIIISKKNQVFALIIEL